MEIYWFEVIILNTIKAMYLQYTVVHVEINGKVKKNLKNWESIELAGNFLKGTKLQ